MLRTTIAFTGLTFVAACADLPSAPAPDTRCQGGDSMMVHNEMAGTGMDSLMVCVSVSMKTDAVR